MDWTVVASELSDTEVTLCVALAGALGVYLWYLRQRRREQEELKTQRAMTNYDHRFECGPVLKQMQRQREKLFVQHRTPAGVREARAARVTAARERLQDEDFFQPES